MKFYPEEGLKAVASILSLLAIISIPTAIISWVGFTYGGPGAAISFLIFALVVAPFVLNSLFPPIHE